MEAVTGVFQQRADAEQAFHQLRQGGTHADRITILTPGSDEEVEKEIQTVPVDSTEQPGMGKAVGALAGGGIGIAGGSLLISLVPGVGPISAVGLLGAAILGAAGATVGASIGNKSETALSQGLPEDELFVYEDALRKGRTVVLALVEDENSATRVRESLQSAGAESVDAAREQWWIGLRDAEEGRYRESGRTFSEDERFFRMGFEAALHARTRCMEFDQVSSAMDAALDDVEHEYPNAQVEEPFTRGYRRGREYYQQLCDEHPKKAA